MDSEQNLRIVNETCFSFIKKIVYCVESDDCGSLQFCWDSICHNTDNDEVCTQFQCTETDDGWLWNFSHLYVDDNFKCEHVDCESERYI